MPVKCDYDFDRVTSFLGDWGPFQRTVVLLLSLSTIPSGYFGMISVFISRMPDFRCKASVDPSNRSGAGTCSRYQVNGNWTQGPGLSNDTEPCLDGWDFGNDTHGSTIVTEWDLVCEDAWKVPFSTSLFFFGVMIGIFICGGLSDRFGRKPVLFFTLFLQGVTALVQACSVSWLMFCFLNCLRGLGQISNYCTSLILGSEMLGKPARMTFVTVGHNLGFGIGYALLPFLAFFIRGWRMLLVASAVPCFLFFPLWWVIPESPRWLLHQGRADEAERVIHNAAKKNKVPAPEVIFMAGGCEELMQNRVEDKRTHIYMDLIRNPNLRNLTIVGVFLWMALTVTYYGLSLSSSNLNGDIYLNCFFSASIDIMAYVSVWLLVERLPRPALMFCTTVFSGVILLTLKLIPEEYKVMLQVFALAGKIGVTCAYCCIYVVLTELMPTVVRNMGLGVASSAGRIGAIISPYIVYLDVYSRILPFIIFGTISMVAAVLSVLLPDTRNSKLPDVISEARPIRCSKMETDESTGFDQATSFLGNYGLFQTTAILLLSFSAAPVGYTSMSAVFVSDTPEFRCNASLQNSSWSGAGRCFQDAENGSRTGGPHAAEPCVRGWVFSRDTYTSTIVTEWGLVCENAWKVPLSTSLLFAGYLCGSFISGHLSDRFGRKPVLFIFLAVHGVTALVQAISVSWVMFCVLNWLKGASHSYSVSIILGSELLPKASRVVFSTLAICLGYCVGYMLLPLSAYFLRGWRMLLVVSAILSFLQMPTWWLIPESPRWLLHQGRVDEAELIIRNAARRNKVPAPEVIFRAVESFHRMDGNSREKRTYNYTDLVRTTNIRNITVLSSSIWMCITFVYYGLSLNTSNLNGNIYLNCFFSAAIDSFTYVVLWLLADRVPRPALLSAAMMYSGFTLLILKLIPKDNLVALQVLSLVAKFGVTGAFTFICLIVTELMPTVVRNMGVGVGATSGFLGTIIAPYILYTGIYMKSLPFLIFATVSIAAAFFGMLLPDTRNSKLPDLIREVKPIRGCGWTKRRWNRTAQV